jgi:general secretion pathway protein C
MRKLGRGPSFSHEEEPGANPVNMKTDKWLNDAWKGLGWGVEYALNHNRCMFVRFFAFLVWVLLAAAAVFWLLRLTVSAPAAPVHTVLVGESVALQGDLTRLLGAAAIKPNTPASAPSVSSEASRFKLMGLMAPQAVASRTRPVPGHGWALISVDGKLARTFTVGGAVDGELVLQSVSLRTAAIGPSNGDALVRLELPPLPQASTGTLAAAPTYDGGQVQPSSRATQQQPIPVSPPPSTDAFIPPPPGVIQAEPDGNMSSEAIAPLPGAEQPSQQQPSSPEGRPPQRSYIPTPPRSNSNLRQRY